MTDSMIDALIRLNMPRIREALDADLNGHPKLKAILGEPRDQTLDVSKLSDDEVLDLYRELHRKE